MTVSTTTNRAGFVCNGVTYQFPFDFKILAESDLQVYLYNTITRLTSQLTLNVDYTVEIASPGPGGTVTLIGAYGPPCPPGVIPGAEYTLTILRAMPRTQEIDFVNGDDLDEQNIEGMGDRITMMVQELDNKMARTLAFPPTSGISNISVPDPVAGAFLRWNLSGNGLENATYVDPTLITISDYWRAVIDGGDTLPEALTAMGLDPSLSTLTLPDNVTISDFIKTLLDDNDAAAARATLGVSLSTVTYVDDYATGDGVEDDTTAIEAAITAAPTGGILQFGAGKTYKITDEISIGKALVLSGYGYSTKINQVTASKKCFIPTVSNVKVYSIWMNGVGHNAYDAGEIAIDAYGASYAAAISGLRIENCFFSNWGNGAIQLKWVTDFSIFKNKINGVHYYGVQGVSVVRGDVSGNIIDDVPASADTDWNAYGIILSRDAVTSLVTDPRPANITVCRNIVSNVTTWEGIDTHGGENIIIQGNTVKACKIGINVGRATDGDNLAAYAPKNVAVLGNTVDSGITNGQAVGNGIIVNGAMLGDGTLVEYAYGCTVVGNTVVGYGLYSDKYGGGIYAYATTGLVISANSVRQCARNGICLDQKNREAVVKGNSIQDIFADSNTNIAGIYVSDGGGNSNFLISDNTVSEHASGATYKLTSTSGYAVLVANTAGNSGKVGLVGGVAGTNFTTLLGDAGSKVSKNLNA